MITDKHNLVFHFYIGANLLIYNAVVEKVSKYAFVFFTTNEILFIFSVFNQIYGLWYLIKFMVFGSEDNYNRLGTGW